jgi:hypothetical protein
VRLISPNASLKEKRRLFERDSRPVSDPAEEGDDDVLVVVTGEVKILLIVLRGIVVVTIVDDDGARTIAEDAEMIGEVVVDVVLCKMGSDVEDAEIDGFVVGVEEATEGSIEVAPTVLCSDW